VPKVSMANSKKKGERGSPESLFTTFLVEGAMTARGAVRY
jgi:hypothetical protein